MGKQTGISKSTINALKKNFLTEDSQTMEDNLCQCGCGQKTLNYRGIYRKFISGHNARVNHGMKGKTHSEEVRLKLSIAHKNLAPWNKGLKGVQTAWNKGLNTKSGMEGKQHTKASKRKMAKAKLGGHRTLESRQKQSLNSKINPNYGMGSKNHSEDCKRRLSENTKRLWSNKDFVKKICKGRAIRPNKPETIILNLLDALYPSEWKYTGDFSFMINGKNPDFVNCNGQKKIIELFGDYFHKGENPKDRAKAFKPFGYETLVIWESELKNMKSVTNRIKRFSEKRVS